MNSNLYKTSLENVWNYIVYVVLLRLNLCMHLHTLHMCTLYVYDTDSKLAVLQISDVTDPDFGSARLEFRSVWSGSRLISSSVMVHNAPYQSHYDPVASGSPIGPVHTHV